MAKASRRRAHLELVETPPAKTARKIKTKFETERQLPPIVPLTDGQARYLEALNSGDVKQLIVCSPAGTGKSWIAATWAADQLRLKKTGKLILLRPNVPCGRSLGFMPGDLEMKYMMWLTPIVEPMKERMGAAAFEIALKRGEIELLPLEIARGRSFHDCIVLGDEIENLTSREAKMLTTRTSETCKMILTGDVSQSDLNEKSGLAVMIHLIRKYNLPIPIIEMTDEDIVRSDLTAKWVKAFYREGL